MQYTITKSPLRVLSLQAQIEVVDGCDSSNESRNLKSILPDAPVNHTFVGCGNFLVVNSSVSKSTLAP